MVEQPLLDPEYPGWRLPLPCETAPGEARIHELKTWPVPFAAVREGRKLYEVRYDDRGFKLGDYLRLREYDLPDCYTGDEVTVGPITYITTISDWAPELLEPSYVVLGWRAALSEDGQPPKLADVLRAQIPNQREVEAAYRKAGEVSQESLRYEVRSVGPTPAVERPTEPSEPPTLMSFLGAAPNLTGGIESGEYLRRLRTADEERGRLTGHEGPYCQCELCKVVLAALRAGAPQEEGERP